MEEKFKLRDVVQETLLIPLYYRALETRRPKGNILKDDLAERLIDRIDYDFSKLDAAPLSKLGCVVRGRYYDDATRRFLSSHGNAVVVNVGCGLDTRYQRIPEHHKGVFYEVDLPEVIELRRALIPEPAGDRYLSASLLDVEWMDNLRAAHPQSSFIFIVEGVLMYFYEEQVRQFIDRIAERFAGGMLCFDVCGPMMSKHRVKPDALKNSAAEIRSGIEDGHLVEQWNPKLRLVEQAIYMNRYRSRWGWMGYTIGLSKRLSCKFSSMLQYGIVESTEDKG